jgi:hypothetical protein
MKRFDKVKQILEDAVSGDTIGAHGNFWRGLTLDQFKVKKVFGRSLVTVGNPDDSNLIKALEGRDPFGSDTGTAGALFKRMPADRPAVPADRIAYIRKWIADNCPDEEDTPAADPNRHNAYWRDFDDWAMFHATSDVEDAIGEFFNRAPKWLAFARDPAKLSDWTTALAEGPAVAALALLGGRILDTVRSHYGNPIALNDLLDSYERFGANTLPDDPLRPVDPRHNMNGEIMWFFYSAFVDASLRGAVPASDWALMGRAVLLGLINDGLFRGRFTVVGFTPDAAGAQAARQFLITLPDANIPGELARRFADSGLTG